MRIILVFLLNIIKVGAISIVDNRNYPWRLPIRIYNEAITQWPMLEKILADIEGHTCIKFQHVDNRIPNNEQGINVLFNSVNNKICEAPYVGAQTPIGAAPTNVYYDEDHCPYKKLFLQRLIHIALGQIPEHDRQDRDDHITVYLDNVMGYKLSKFQKVNYALYPEEKLPYNFGSITHGFWRHFTRESSMVAFEAKQYNFIRNRTMGQIFEVSFNDYKALNYMICSHECDNHKKLICEHGGYQNPKNCNECSCPSGFTGKTCHDYVDFSGYIGGVTYYKCKAKRIIATNHWQKLKLESRLNCHYYIEAGKQRRRIYLEIENYHGETSEECYGANSIEIRYQADKGVTGLCLCNRYNYKFNVLSENNLLYLHYNGKYAWEYINLKYKFVYQSEIGKYKETIK
uniref:Metalloendopeptidase n=1 Tax=Parastrongyloides trichosuri TaxID=131310 RepID=A0A0N4ZZF5_PARTI